MDLSRFIAFLSLLGLSFVSALLFEARMTRGYHLELVILFIGLVFSIIASVSLLEDEASGWFLATLIFGAALVNGIVLFLMIKSFALLILSLVVNITGMIFSVLSAAEIDDDDDDDFDLETYDKDDEDYEDDDEDDKDYEDDYVEVQPVKPKRKYTKRKTTAKKTTKKRKYTKRK